MIPDLPPARAVFADSAPQITHDTTVEIGARLNLTSSDPSSRRATWTSSAPSVVTVSGSGEAVARGVGTATLRQTDRLTWQEVKVLVIASSTEAPSSNPSSPPIQSGLPNDWSTGAALPAELPRVSVDTTYPVRTGRTLRVAIGQKIQPALDSARYGDEIVLAAGGSWTEGIVLPVKSGSGWILVRTDGTPPTAAQRVQPATATSGRFAKILAPNNSTAAISTAAGTSGWRLVGIEVAAAPAVTSLNSLIRIGDAYATSVAAQPDRIVLDRMYIHGSASLPLVRCIQLHGRATAIMHSYITECHHEGQDSQAIVGWNGPGPYLIANNYLAGAGENIMFGGATPTIPNMLPSDIIIRGNHITKPTSWRNVWLVKNLLELKFAIRVLIEGNVIENVWANGQVGNALVLKSAGTSGMNGIAETRDVTIRSNIIRNAAFGGIAMAAAPEGPAVAMSRITIVNNLISRLGPASDYGTRDGRALTTIGGIAHLLISYNTITSPDIPIALWSDGSPPRQPGFTLRGNVIERGTYGIWGSGGEGSTTINNRYSSSTVIGNIFFGGTLPVTQYPAGTINVSSPQLLFKDWGTGDLQLKETSGLLTAGPQGSLPGVQWSILNIAARQAAP